MASRLKTYNKRAEKQKYGEDKETLRAARIEAFRKSENRRRSAEILTELMHFNRARQLQHEIELIAIDKAVTELFS